MAVGAIGRNKKSDEYAHCSGGQGVGAGKEGVALATISVALGSGMVALAVWLGSGVDVLVGTASVSEESCSAVVFPTVVLSPALEAAAGAQALLMHNPSNAKEMNQC